ncbi:MAG: hypothetical protein R2849_09650 [Thermomicrobiales bacterium]
MQVFNGDGVFFKGMGLLGTGNASRRPSDIVVQGQAVYVVDLGNDRVQTFSLEGAYLGQFGSGYLDHPAQLAIAASGMMYITDFQMHLIAGEYNPATANWTYFGEGSGPGSSRTPPASPSTPAARSTSAESGNSRIQVLASNTAYQTQWARKLRPRQPEYAAQYHPRPRRQSLRRRLRQQPHPEVHDQRRVPFRDPRRQP